MIGKFDCRDFCHISSLEDKISNTAATIQPNPFGFGKNYIYQLNYRLQIKLDAGQFDKNHS